MPPLAFVLLLHDQNWHYLYLNSTEEKDLSSDTQIRVIGSMESEICTKMLRNFSEKLVANLWRLHGRNCLEIAFSESFELEGSLVESQ